MKNLFFSLSVFILFLISNQLTTAQWVQRYNGAGNSYDQGNSIALDKQGYIYVNAHTTGIGGPDITTIKYNYNGVPQWIQTYDSGTPYDYAKCMALDDSGNVYITGSTRNEITTGDDLILLKYNPNGNFMWLRKYTLNFYGFDGGSYVTVDLSGNVYVTGQTASMEGSADAITLKYSSNGVLIWMRTYNGQPNMTDWGTSVKHDNSGNVYVTGSSFGSISEFDYITIKYDSSGVLQWSKLYNGTGNFTDQPIAMAVDRFANVYVSGFSYGIEGNMDYLTIKYNSSGESLWVKRYNNPLTNNNEQPRSIVIDDLSNVYVTGIGREFDEEDMLTIKYDPDGMQQWVKYYYEPGTTNDYSSAIEIDGVYNIYVTGFANQDFVTIKYNNSGQQQWVQKYFHLNLHQGMGRAIKADSSGNVYVTGYSFGSGTGADLVTLKYSGNHSRNLNLKVYLEGFYNEVNNKMVGDTIKILIRRDYYPSYPVIDSAVSIIDSNGQGTFNFPYTSNGLPVYLVLKHRNSIETWSQLDTFNYSDLSYDFTTSSSMAYGNNLVLKGSKYCIYSGDVSQDGFVDLTDLYQIYNDASIGATGYLKTDLNGDNYTDLSDLLICFNNSSDFVKFIRP